MYQITPIKNLKQFVLRHKNYSFLLCCNRQFIDFLVETTETSFSSIHLMGHSLGAHVVGGAGAAVTLGRIPRITGYINCFVYVHTRERTYL